MLKINIICIGKIKEKYFADAVEEYSKRLGAFCKFSVTELSEERLSGDTPSQIEIVIREEGKRILKKINPSDYVAAMCIEGKQLSSVELSRQIDSIAVSGKSAIAFVIGGSYGLSDEVKQRAQLRLSMSKMTFPHQLARVMLAEQIYRAFEISTNGKYHK